MPMVELELDTGPGLARSEPKNDQPQSASKVLAAVTLEKIGEGQTMMIIPDELVPAVRELIARRTSA